MEQTEAAGVYFFVTADERFVKIGYSAHILVRLSQIRTIGPGTAETRLIGYLPGTQATERWLHRRFADLRDAGEWFSYVGELREFTSVLLPVPPPVPPQQSPPRLSVSVPLNGGGPIDHKPASIALRRQFPMGTRVILTEQRRQMSRSQCSDPRNGTVIGYSCLGESELIAPRIVWDGFVTPQPYLPEDLIVTAAVDWGMQ